MTPHEALHSLRRCTPAELRWMRESIDLTQEDIARLVGVGAQTILRMENGYTVAKFPYECILRAMYAQESGERFCFRQFVQRLSS